MAAILPSNGGNSEGLGGIEEKFSQEDFRVYLVSLVFLVSLVCLVSLVSWVIQHSKRFSPNSRLDLLSAISYQPSAISYLP